MAPTNESTSRRHPSEIKVHGKSRVLPITSYNDARSELPCESLRVFYNATEVHSSPTPDLI
jgi:DUF971 family protein